MSTFEFGKNQTHGSPTIAPSQPGGAYRPRPDQLLAVMKKQRCTLAEAREICQSNHAEWRDRIRKWRWVMDAYGTYVRVEDTR